MASIVSFDESAASSYVDDTDEDCDGLADDLDSGTASAGKSLWYVDDDGDGFGDPLLTASLACDDPSDGGTVYADQADDCDDGDAAVNPDAAEIDGDETFSLSLAAAMLPAFPTATKYSSCRSVYLKGKGASPRSCGSSLILDPSRFQSSILLKRVQ